MKGPFTATLEVPGPFDFPFQEIRLDGRNSVQMGKEVPKRTFGPVSAQQVTSETPASQSASQPASQPE